MNNFVASTGRDMSKLYTEISELSKRTYIDANFDLRNRPGADFSEGFPGYRLGFDHPCFSRQEIEIFVGKQKIRTETEVQGMSKGIGGYFDDHGSV
jgi:hypothetical protein